MTDYWWRK